MKEVEKPTGKVILFIMKPYDCRSGRAEGSIDASNMLKPALTEVNSAPSERRR